MSYLKRHFENEENKWPLITAKLAVKESLLLLSKDVRRKKL